MRISDWSSDVCSSDLCANVARYKCVINHFARCCPQKAITNPNVVRCTIALRRLKHTVLWHPEVRTHMQNAFVIPSRHNQGCQVSRGRQIKATINGASKKRRSEEHTSELQSLMRI